MRKGEAIPGRGQSMEGDVQGHQGRLVRLALRPCGGEDASSGPQGPWGAPSSWPFSSGLHGTVEADLC